MLNAISKTFQRLWGDEKGLTLVEYGVGAILAVTVGATALVQLGREIDNELGQAEAIMENTTGTAVTTDIASN